MKRSDYRRVIEDLRAKRARLYRQLAGAVGRSGERDLAARAGDLLTAEEILLEQAEEGSGADADPAAPDAGGIKDTAGIGEDDTPDYAVWERSGEWEHLGEFRRLPHGGVLVDYRSGKEIFVPEAVIRSEAVAHGDVLGAKTGGSAGRRPIYRFAVLDRRDRADESERRSFIAPLEFRAGQWGAVSAEDELFITVPDGDVSALNLAEGDLIEVGYRAGEPASARVAWRFDPDDAFVRLRTLRKESPGVRKRAEAAAEPQTLAGATVLVVGADAYKETFKRVFERRGAKFTWESGFMVGKFLESKVRRADVVVIVTEAMKHKMPDVEAVCDRHGKPYVYAPSRGASGALRELLKLPLFTDG